MKTLTTRRLTGNLEIDQYLTLGLGLEDLIETQDPYSFRQPATLLEFMSRVIGRENLKDFLETHFTKEEIENTTRSNSHHILIMAGILFPAMMKTQRRLLIEHGHYHKEFLEKAKAHKQIATYQLLAAHATDNEILEEMKDHPDQKIRKILAKRGYFLNYYLKNSPVEVGKQLIYHNYKLDELVKSKEPAILCSLAAAGHYLDQLMEHPNENVRARVINRKFKLDHFENDPNPIIQQKLMDVRRELKEVTQGHPGLITNPRKIHEKCLLLHQVNPNQFLQTESAQYLTHEHPRIKEIFDKTIGKIHNLLHPIYANEVITIANSYTYHGDTDIEALKKNIQKANDQALEKGLHFYILENMKSEMTKEEWSEVKEFAEKNTRAVFIKFDFTQKVK